MTREIMRTLLIVATTVAVGCGGSQQTETASDTSHETAEATKKVGRPAYIPPANPYGRIGAATLDSLRTYKHKFNITRDEYWNDTGGVLANDYFEVWYPVGRTTVTHGMRVFIEIMPARQKLEQFFGRAPEHPLVIHIPPHMENYKAETGRDWWYYGDLRSDSLTFQPVYVLVKRHLASIAIPHEYYQWAIGRLTNYAATRWLEEGVASYLCGEGDLLDIQIKEFSADAVPMSVAKVDDVLIMEETKQDARIAYYHSYRMVKQIVDEFGEDKLKALLLALGGGSDRDAASRSSLGIGYDELLDRLAYHSQGI